jgi:hypothetical protein
MQNYGRKWKGMIMKNIGWKNELKELYSGMSRIFKGTNFKQIIDEETPNDDEKMRLAMGFPKEDWGKNKKLAAQISLDIKKERLEELLSGECKHKFHNKWVDGYNLVCHKCGFKRLGKITLEQS